LFLDLENMSLNHGIPQITDTIKIIKIVDPKLSIALPAAILLIYGVENRAKLITVEVATQDKNVNIFATFILTSNARSYSEMVWRPACGLLQGG